MYVDFDSTLTLLSLQLKHPFLDFICDRRCRELVLPRLLVGGEILSSSTILSEDSEKEIEVLSVSGVKTSLPLFFRVLWSSSVDGDL